MTNLDNELRGVPFQLGGHRIHRAVDVGVGVDSLHLVMCHYLSFVLHRAVDVVTES